ncbi:glycosyl transferase family 90-domain-containing protein [Mycena floridula]|nr:glycosyl transferase family 90-domain-containing protein [Mycena floridula]
MLSRRRFLRILFVFLVLLVIIQLTGVFSTYELPFIDYDGDSYVEEKWPEPEFPLGEHTYRQDGLLQVNEGGAHPIFELMRVAEKEWKRKLNASSTTLDEAIREYRRRYRRDPPKGFDSWWNYVKRHNVQLPDEYDSIFNDLEPFWGINPADLIKSAFDLESQEDYDSYTLGKNDTGPVGVMHTSFAPGKYEQLIEGSVKILDLLREVDEFLPPFRAVFSPHDVPTRFSDYNVKTAHLDAAKSKTYIPGIPATPKKGWVSACAPDSPLAQLHPLNLDEPLPPKSTKSFIHDHLKLMDPCLHPELLYHHGQFLAHHYGPKPEMTLVPQFSYCATTVHHDIRIPTPYDWLDDIAPSENPGWLRRKDARLLWRGINTGILYAEDMRWRASHRTFLVQTANDLNGTIDVLLSPSTPANPVGSPKSISKSSLNPALFDIGFSGDPLCASASVCQALQKMFTWTRKMLFSEAIVYRYVLDVDGNGWSGRFKRLMTSKAVVFKSTVYPEWYMERIAPWLHYVPVQVDLSDLHDALIFFRGDAHGHGAHENLARKIALEGRNWSRTFWRREDLVAYFFRLILEYARLMSPDREAMSFQLDGSKV